MFRLGTPAVEIVVRGVVVYLATLVGLRLMGKRELGQMTVFDLVVILLIANAVQNAMVGPDTSLIGGVVSAFVILAANRIVAGVRLRNKRLEVPAGRDPTVLIEHGQFITRHLDKEGLDRAGVGMAMREHGVASLNEVQLADLETDGSISIVPTESKVVRTRRRVRQVRH